MTFKKIIATDLDGTFLRSDHSFDKKRLTRILDQFEEKGYLFVAASGRSLASIQSVFAGFEDRMGFIAENGSLVTYQDEVIYRDQPIAPETYLAIADGIAASPFGATTQILLSGHESAYVLASADPTYLSYIRPYYQLQLVNSFTEVAVPIVKIVGTFGEKDLKAGQAWVNSHFLSVTAVTTGFDSVDIILSGINKAVGLNKLCQHLGLSATDVIAFGDNENDLEMLEFAGLAVATSNAQDSAKERADLVIGSCQEDAVLDYMENQL